MDLTVQPVSPAPDSPVAKEPQAGEDQGANAGEGIFSLLFLLSVMGKNEGQNPARHVLREEEAGMRPGNSGETSMSYRLTEEYENVIPAQAGIQNVGRGLDSQSPLTTCEDKLCGNDGHLGVFSTDLSQAAAVEPKSSAPQIFPHAVDTKGDVTGDPSIVPVFLKESGYQNNSGMSSDPQGEYPWMGDANGVSVMKDPGPLSADNKLLSFPMHIDQENILQQLSARMARVRETGTHSARIRLHPDELGELSMDISVTNNSVRACIRVENYHVKEIIEANLNRLETELKNQGLSMEQFTVETGGRGFKENYDLSHDRGDSAVRRMPGRAAMDHSADQGHLMIHDPMGRGIVNLFV